MFAATAWNIGFHVRLLNIKKLNDKTELQMAVKAYFCFFSHSQSPRGNRTRSSNPLINAPLIVNGLKLSKCKGLKLLLKNLSCKYSSYIKIVSFSFFRTEYWKSNPRHFCEACKCWFGDNKVVSIYIMCAASCSY